MSLIFEIIKVFGMLFKAFFSILIELFPIVSELSDLPSVMIASALGVPTIVVSGIFYLIGKVVGDKG